MERKRYVGGGTMRVESNFEGKMVCGECGAPVRILHASVVCTKCGASEKHE